MSPEEFRTAAHELVDWIVDYLEHIERFAVASAVQPGDIAALIPVAAPTQPEPFAEILADLDRVVVPGLTHWQHPNFFAYFPANVSYPAILGELAAAGLGVQGMSWVTSPACTEVETAMMDWMVELLGLPERFASTSENGGGVIHGSASEATLASILAARWRASGGVVNRDGDTSRLVAYATSQAHSSIEKGLRIAGIGTDRLRTVAHDEAFAMRVDDLERLVAADLAAGLTPFWVGATRGTTSSMAFDPLAGIGEVAVRHGLWLHVDGAMAGIGALAAEHRWVNDGLEFADSYCTNPHKWMGVNFDCDLFYVADRRALLGALSILPEYLRSAAAESGRAIDYRDWQVPLGRRFRALKLWFALRSGAAPDAAAMIRRQVGLTAHLAAQVVADERFEIVAPYPLNLLCVALRAGDEATEAMIATINASGAALLTRTVLDGRVVCRVSIGATRTEQRHVDALWRQMQACAEGGAVDGGAVDGG